eukprot:TRINITY_DN10596_c0_g1_i1.p1 TRINITY_DN10596_c0_g1~~TRINITY_DN10596_c0_g1_i1.p1  ORF type:complete len:777 (+),score=244.02 TRINITY_DN10596_c0_g1_i1:141-2471(+)
MSSQASSASSSSTKVKVVVRVRPSLKHEAGAQAVIVENNGIILRNLKIQTKEALKYKFDSCYDDNSLQEAIFQNEINPVLHHVFKGINTTVFSYGVTGAGKTHTMQGTAADPGIIPRAVARVINLIQEKEAEHKQANPTATTPICVVTVSYLEIYNEKVYDLLGLKDQDLPIREDEKRNIFIPGLEEVDIKTFEDFEKTYQTGCKNRTVASTKLNSQSSRSHAILMLKVVTKDTKSKKFLTGKLHLIDLAGSEDNRRTENAGIRLQESSNINQSLFVLGKVVNALNEPKGVRAPYRDSKLTRLLQDSLGGNSFSVIIANIAPGQPFYFDTANTLNFASKSKLIVNTPVVNSEDIDKPLQVIDINAQLQQYQEKRKKLEEANMQAKRKKVDPSNSSLDKENIQAMKQEITARVEQTVREQILGAKASLLSPFIKDHKLVQEVTLQRMQRLEGLLFEHSMQEIDAYAEVPSKRETKIMKGNETPCTKLAILKRLIRDAKSHEQNGKIAEAIEACKQARQLMMDEDYAAFKDRIGKLDAKIADLEQNGVNKPTEQVQPSFQPFKRVDEASPYASRNSDASATSQTSNNSVDFSTPPAKLNFDDVEDERNGKKSISPSSSEESKPKKGRKRKSPTNASEISSVEKVAKAPRQKRRGSYKETSDSEGHPSDSDSDYEVEKKAPAISKVQVQKAPVEDERLGQEPVDPIEKRLLELLNTLSEKDLQKRLAGVGKVKSQQIVQRRSQRAFTNFYELADTSFGPQIFAKTAIKKFVSSNCDIKE